MIVGMPVWVLIVYALAVARLTGLAVTDKITEPARVAVLNRFNPASRAHRALAYLTGAADDDAQGCPWCASIWIAGALAPLAWWWGTHPGFAIPAIALAASQVTGMLSHLGRG